MISRAITWRPLLVKASLLLLGSLIVVATFTPTVAHLAPRAAAWAYNTRTLVCAASAVVIISLFFGLVLGAASALGPPAMDALVARSIELSGALPLLALATVYRTSADLPPMVLAAAMVAPIKALEISRMVRTQSLGLLRQPFVTASRALGASSRRLFRTHLFPYVIGTAATSAAFAATWCVGLDVALRVLGGTGSTTGGPAAAPVMLGVAITGASYLLADELERHFASSRF